MGFDLLSRWKRCKYQMFIPGWESWCWGPSSEFSCKRRSNNQSQRWGEWMWNNVALWHCVKFTRYREESTFFRCRMWTHRSKAYVACDEYCIVYCRYGDRRIGHRSGRENIGIFSTMSCKSQEQNTVIFSRPRSLPGFLIQIWWNFASIFRIMGRPGGACS